MVNKVTHQTYLTRLPFPADDGTSRYRVAGDMTNDADADADFKWTVDSPAGINFD